MTSNDSAHIAKCVESCFDSKICCRGAENDSIVESSTELELTNSRDGSNDLTKLELVENGGLSCGVESNHQDSHFLLSEETRDCSIVAREVRSGAE